MMATPAGQLPFPAFAEIADAAAEWTNQGVF
jgi:hypothetical protein